jgi:steroid 5-alpha reductase family enzyme
MPALVIAANPAPSVSLVEWLGFALAVAAFLTESVADIQKAGFIAKTRQAGERHRVCDVGLWRYSRHPNYFAEWMVWNGLILMALPSLPHLFRIESVVVAGLLTAGLFFVSRIMYVTLVYYTGAKPSEFYSVRKRPDYAAYQKRTNIFFPGRPRA